MDLIWQLIAYLTSWASYRAVLICLLSVPFTHVLAVILHTEKVRLQEAVLFPFTGGQRHVIFQLCSWALWLLSALSIAPVYLGGTDNERLPTIPKTHVDVISGAAAVTSFVGEVFMLKALLVYESQKRQHGHGKDAGEEAKRSPRKGSKGRRFRITPRVASALVVVMGLMLCLTGFLLLLAIEYMPDVPSRVLYCCLALSCFLIAGSSTYGLGGHLRYQHGYSQGQGRRGAEQGQEEEGPEADAWRFFQPFAGGTAFVATQALGWSLFSATMVCVILLVKHVVFGVAYCLRCWALGAGILMLVSQMLLGVSLALFKGRRQLLQPRKLQQMARTPVASLAHPAALAFKSWAGLHAPVVLMYLPIHIFFATWSLSFAFLPPRLAVALWGGMLLPYYLLTSRGEPQHTGCRRWPALLHYVRSHIQASLTHWFGHVEVIRDFGGPNPDPSRRYIFGFQPHGLYPTGAGFLPMLPGFRAAFPGVDPVTLTATALHYPPGIRDISGWAGFRQVGRATFVRALREAGSVVLCPGGQAELVHTYKAFLRDRQFVVYAGHKGFVRVALEQGACLVPVLALGEVLQMRDAWSWPALQRYTYRRLGFPVPYIPVGKWRLLPLPDKVPLYYVLGEPIEPPEGLVPGQPVSEAHVAAMHCRFYAALEGLYRKYHHLHPALKDAQLVMLHAPHHHQQQQQ